jgi:hypothetical protein
VDWRIIQGDCLDVLKTLADESVDACVTDPPAGIGFMGREWDGDKGGKNGWIAWLQAVMVEVLRVLKPGGHTLVWAIPRTSHWTATAVEDAGFEVRDVITAITGQGFPKGLSVGKAIDKAAGAELEVIGKNPTWREAKRNNAIMEPVRGGGAEVITASTTDEAKTWEGFGTALKPSSEHWILARKPLIGTVAQNVTEHGTGALNIDECRIGYQGDADKASATPQGRVTSGTSERIGAKPSVENKDRQEFERPEQKGRWPPKAVASSAPSSSRATRAKAERAHGPGASPTSGLTRARTSLAGSSTGMPRSMSSLVPRAVPSQNLTGRAARSRVVADESACGPEWATTVRTVTVDRRLKGPSVARAGTLPPSSQTFLVFFAGCLCPRRIAY